MRERLDTIYQSARYYHHISTCRNFQRLLNLSPEETPLTSELRLLFFTVLHWLQENDLVVDKTVVSRRNAVVGVREHVSAVKYGPRLLMDLEELILDLPEEGQDVLDPERGPHSSDWETLISTDVYLETILNSVEIRHTLVEQAVQVLFGSLPRGTVTVSRQGQRGPPLQEPTEPITEPLAQARAVLDAFLKRDPTRSGTLDLEGFSHELILCFLPRNVDGHDQIEISTEQFDILQRLIYQYRDNDDGTICYLDFWAMIFMETIRDGRLAVFNELADKAHNHMMGMDEEQRSALLVYAGYFPLHKAKSEGDHKCSVLITRSVLKRLAMAEPMAMDEPGALSVLRPLLRFTRSCRTLPPALGWPRYCRMLEERHQPRRPRSKQSCRRGYVPEYKGPAPLSQWDVSHAASDLIKGYLAHKREENRADAFGVMPRPKPADALDLVDWKQQLKNGGKLLDDLEPDGTAKLGRFKVCSEIGRYASDGKAASPVKQVKDGDPYLQALIDQILQLAPHLAKSRLVMSADIGQVERTLAVMRERKRRQGMRCLSSLKESDG